ncbi:MAG: hypothetical protein ABII79_03105 [bacterium]
MGRLHPRVRRPKWKAKLYKLIKLVLAVAAFAVAVWTCYSGDKRWDEIQAAAEENPELEDPELAQRYPLGYAIFVVDGKRHSVNKLKESSTGGPYVIDWSTAELLSYSETMVTLRAPDMTAPIAMNGNTLNLGVRGRVRLSVFRINSVEAWIEVVERRRDYLFAVLGFRSDEG